MSFKSVALAAVGFLAVAGAVAADKTLVVAERGRTSDYRIVVRADAAPSERYAAEEFAKWTKALTGVELPVVDDRDALPAKAVVLGLTRHTEGLVPGAAVATQVLGWEGFRLVMAGDRLVILGSPTRGITYGVHETMNAYGGIEWFAPWRTYVPKTGILQVPAKLDRTEKPVIEIRDQVTYQISSDPEFAIKMRINGFHQGFAERLGPSPYMYDGSLPWAHSLPLIVKPEKYKDAHPEYFAMDAKGARQTGPGYQLCCSNPDVVRIVTDCVVACAKRRTDIRYFGVSQNDGSPGPQQCHCPACRAIDEREDCWGASTLQLVNRVAEAVEKVRPDATVTTLAYRYTQKPPKTIRPRANVMPLFCSVDCDFAKPVERCDFRVNREFLSDLEGWKKVCSRGLFLWDYPMNYMRTLLPFPCIRATCSNIRHYADCGVRGFYLECCTNESAEFSELKSWLFSKLMWNPYQPAEPLIEKFVKGCYGKAAPYMFEYIAALKKLDRKGVNRPLQIEMRNDDPGLTREFCAEIEDVWKRAREEFPKGAPAKLVRRLGAPADYLTVFRHPLADLTGRADPARPARFAFVRERAEALLAFDAEQKAKRSRNEVIGRREMGYLENFVKMPAPDAEAHVSADFDDWIFENNDWWGHELVEDETAVGGRARRYWGTWCGYFRFYHVVLPPKATCRVSVRAKLPKGAPKSGSPLTFLPVDSRDLTKTQAPLALDAAKLSETEYRWVEVGTLKPDYWTHLRMSGAEPGVILDGIRIEKK